MEDDDAIRQHHDLRGSRQGAQGRAGAPRDGCRHRRVQAAARSGMGGLQRGDAARLVRGRQSRQEVSADVEKLGAGFLFTEGPLWHPTGKFLLFSDMPGDHLRRWSAADGVTTFRKPCNKSNGLAWDREARLLVCEHASSQVTRTERDGRSVPIATHFEGKQLNSPNDIVCAADGAIYFTDPPYGRA